MNSISTRTKRLCLTLVLILTLLIVCPPRSQTQELPRLNGDWWATLPADFKLGFILGYQEGFKMALGQILAYNEDFPGSSQALTQDYLNKKFYLETEPTSGEIEQEINRIYADKANRPMHIYSAITVALMQLQGLPEKTIQSALEQHRKATELYQEKAKQTSENSSPNPNESDE